MLRRLVDRPCDSISLEKALRESGAMTRVVSGNEHRYASGACCVLAALFLGVIENEIQAQPPMPSARRAQMMGRSRPCEHHAGGLILVCVCICVCLCVSTPLCVFFL